MRLLIAEKPELAKAIVDGLGGGSRQNGYYDCGSDKVTWCYGHMLMLLEPEVLKPSEIHKCMSCSAGLIRRNARKKYFWGCSNYPECKQSYPDSKGRPNYQSKKVT